MCPYEASFDASQFTPSQAQGAHPAGVFDATISNTLIKPTKAADGGLFEVEFSTNSGRISNRYNLWNPSPQAVEIAHKELSALCYATGIFKLDFRNDGAALRNARCKIEVAKQANSEYMEVKRVLDMNGNEPGRAPAPASVPMTRDANGGWGAQTEPAKPAALAGWSSTQAQPQSNPPANPNAPPWAQR